MILASPIALAPVLLAGFWTSACELGPQTEKQPETQLGKQSQEVIEYDLGWPSTIQHSTHELVTTPEAIYITGQNMAMVAKMGYDGQVEHWEMPPKSGPHGILVDSEDRLWVSLEFKGTVARLDGSGHIVQEIDVKMKVEGSKDPINPHPHGIALDADGKTIWFTGKKPAPWAELAPTGPWSTLS